jgi:hypothetical protein
MLARFLANSITVVITVLSFGLYYSPALADDPATSGLHLTLSPPTLMVNITPGGTYTTQIRIKNDGTKTELIHMNIEKFTTTNLDGRIYISAPSPTDDFVHWVTFGQNSFSILPGEWRTQTVTFKVPSSAAFDYNYALEFVRAKPAEEDTVTTNHLTGAIASAVLLEVANPNARREIKIVDFKTTPSTFFEFPPVYFEVTLKNIGNVYLIPKGNIFVEQGENKQIATLDVNKEGSPVLAGASRRFTTSWSEGFVYWVDQTKDGKAITNGEGNPNQELQWNFNKLTHPVIGPYDAKLLVVYDDGHRDIPLEAKTSFWVFPWKLLAGILLALILPIFLTIFITRKLTLRSLRKRQLPQNNKY